MGHPEKYINEQGYITPRDPYILAVEEVFGGHVCLDPASSSQANEHSIQAAYHYDGWPADGLIFGWDSGIAEMHGHTSQWAMTTERWTVFLNPPYGRLFGDTGPFNVLLWTNKMVKDYRNGKFDEGILLVNAFTGAQWFQKLWQFPICFTDHRIKFVNPGTMTPDNQPGYYNAFVYMGPRPYHFVDVFSGIGTTVAPIRWSQDKLIRMGQI